MMRSLFSGVSGIRNHQSWLDVIGNNIANVNTIGFKSSRASFAEILTQTLRDATAPHGSFGGTNPMQIGLGIELASVDTQFQQGTFESTGNYTDLAIEGDGFFVLSSGDQTYFTRSGAFNIDAEGYLTAQGGSMRVQGYTADQLGSLALNLAPSDIQIPFGMKAPASATTEIDLYCNLDAEASDSIATLLDSGTTGVSQVSGTAFNGAGGTYAIDIAGTTNATQGSGIGANTFGVITTSTTLGDMGIDVFDDFEITVTGEAATTITLEPLSATNTIGDLINAINAQVPGITASWDDTAGEIRLTSDYYGTTPAISLAGGGGNGIYEIAFGGAAYGYTAGDASDLSATATFTPNDGSPAITTYPTLVANELGLFTDISGVGGGGITISAADGLAPGSGTSNQLMFTTDDTTHTTSIVTYDSLGGQHVLNITFTKTSTQNYWNWEIDVEEPAQIISGSTGHVTFNDDGSLESFAYDGGVFSFSFNPNNGAAPIVDITLDPGIVDGVNGITQFASPTTTIVQSQDGYGMGDLSNIFIDENGTIIGSFTNDQTLTLAQIVLADFNNPQGLNKEGGNLYKVSANTGDPIYGLPQTNFGSGIFSGYVEMSNVDLSKQFADMIVAQRGFQASARVITTADRLLDEITRLKRM